MIQLKKTSNKQKTFRQVETEQRHGKKVYRLRQQLTQEQTKEIKDYTNGNPKI